MSLNVPVTVRPKYVSVYVIDFLYVS